MQKLIRSLESTAENLALDEWLLTRCESSPDPLEAIRVWENPRRAVIIGRSSKVTDEVNVGYCDEHDIEYLRRSSGGASVVIGPGCLMYAVVLDYRLRPELKMLDQAHHFVMSRIQNSVTACGVDVKFQGTCDLTLNGRKFSGNSLRCQRQCFLYHGTLLYNFDLNTVQECLGTPPRQPDYREGRTHLDFVTNIPVQPNQLTEQILTAWNPAGEVTVNENAVRALAQEKYDSKEWTFKR